MDNNQKKIIHLLKCLLSNLDEYLAVLFFLFIFTLMTVQVFTRYVLGFSFSWNAELSRYLFVWLTFLGAAYVRKVDAHIKIDFIYNHLYNKLPDRIKKLFSFLKWITSMVFLVLITYLGFVLANKSSYFTSQALQISQFYLYISVSVGGVFYLFREIQSYFKELKDKSKE